MPVKKYLELDSTFRNRNLYPNCGDFIVNIAQGGQKTQLNAVDPVSEAYPLLKFSPFPTPFNLKLCLENIITTDPLPLVSTNATTTIIVIYSYIDNFLPGYFWSFDNFFSGLALINKSANKYLTRRILKSKYMTSIKTGNITDSYIQLELDLPIPSDYVLSSTTTFQVLDPTTLNLDYLLFLPRGVDICNYYRNYYVYNESKNSYCLIESYDNKTRIAKLDNTNVNFNWQLTDIYTIIKKLPILTGLATTSLAGFPNSIDIGKTTSPNLINCFYYNYDGLVSVDVNNLYIYKIINIIGKTKDNTYTTVLDLMVSYTQYIIIDVYADDSYSLVPGTNGFQILPYSYDNAVNFNYTGSMSSLTQPCAYDVKLNSLSLPNVLLESGGYIWNLPFVYVEIENVSTSSNSSNNVIYSNNPFVSKTVFKVPLTNITNPEQYQYLNYTGNDMTQTLVIKPNSDMHLVIKLPNGEIFSPINEIFVPGQPSNPFLQLNAVFSFEKI